MLFGNLNTTFRAFADNADALEASIAGGPRALDVATRELPAQAGFEADSAELFRRFQKPFRSLASASVHLAPAFRAGTPALKISPQLNDRIVATLNALDTFVSDPRVMPALQRLTHTANLADPLLAFLTPAQTTCNYASLLFRNLGSALSEGDAVGTFLRTVPIVAAPEAQQRGGPVVGAGQRAAGRPDIRKTRSATPTCTATRTRTPRRRARPGSASPASTSTCPSSKSSATSPATRAPPSTSPSGVTSSEAQPQPRDVAAAARAC